MKLVKKITYIILVGLLYLVCSYSISAETLGTLVVRIDGFTDADRSSAHRPPQSTRGVGGRHERKSPPCPQHCGQYKHTGSSEQYAAGRIDAT